MSTRIYIGGLYDDTRGSCEMIIGPSGACQLATQKTLRKVSLTMRIVPAAKCSRITV